MELIKLYFPELSKTQLASFEQLYSVYQEWNQKINVISRKDIEFLYLNHVLHSLSIARLYGFAPNTSIIDIGTGGGFPGIPLAIYFPEVRFYLIDSIGKKIRVVNEVIDELQLKNVVAKHENAKVVNKRFDFSISRAVAPLSDLISWSRPLINRESKHTFRNGLICLKGGDITAELVSVKPFVQYRPIYSFFPESYFKEKYVLHAGLD